MKRIICMLVVLAAVTATAQAVWTIDGPSVGTGGWNAIWNGVMSWDVSDDSAVSGGVKAWWFVPTDAEPQTPILAGGVNQAETMKWYIRPVVAGPKSGGNRYAYAPTVDTTKWGATFVNPADNGGLGADVAVIATMLSKDEMLVQHDWGYQYYRPYLYSWENKPYFKTDARIASVNGEGATMRINTYAYAPDTSWDAARSVNKRRLISYTDIALSATDMEWQTIHTYAAAKADTTTMYGVWENAWLMFEVEIIGGNEDTRLFIDELDFFSNEFYDPVLYPEAAASGIYWELPEPATMSILALGGLLLRKKK
jgi:hypothetical protein